MSDIIIPCNATDTSRKSAKKLKEDGSWELNRNKIWVFLVMENPNTYNYEEIYKSLDIDRSTCTSCCNSLSLEGKVKDSGIRSMMSKGKMGKEWKGIEFPELLGLTDQECGRCAGTGRVLVRVFGAEGEPPWLIAVPAYADRAAYREMIGNGRLSRRSWRRKRNNSSMQMSLVFE